MHNAKILISQASLLLAQVLRFEHPSDAVLSHFFREHKRLRPRARTTLAETVYTVLRQKIRLEMLARTAPKGMGSRERRLAILAFAGSSGFLHTGLNANEATWLKSCQAFPETELQDAHRHNLPDWLVPLLSERLGRAGLQSFGKTMLDLAPLDLRVNTLLGKREDVLALLQKADIQADITPYSPWGLRVEGRPRLQKLDVFTQGLIEVQDEGSQLLALLLAPKRREVIVDFCAGVGGKTLALGAQMRNTGRLYALDISAYRLKALTPRLARAQLSNVYPVVIAHERDERIKRLRGKVNRVLVDAPCSGLGTLRRNPDLKWRCNPKTLAALCSKQSSILQNAATLLKPGGRLVYATCSVLREENENIAQAFTTQHSEFVPLDAGVLVGNADLAQQGYLQLWPQIHNTDGFFAAVWEKT